MADEALRKKLDEMAEKHPRHEHTAIIQKLWLKHRHSIAVEPNSDQLTDFNCVVLSFGLQDDVDYRSIVHTHPGVYAGRDFMNYVLDRNLLTPVESEAARPNDMAVYFKDGGFTHTGRVMVNGTIVSKWGRGQIYRHALWEVPFSYGHEMRFFKTPELKTARDIFQAFAKTKGVEFMEEY
jgi:hypothetical protein